MKKTLTLLTCIIISANCLAEQKEHRITGEFDKTTSGDGVLIYHSEEYGVPYPEKFKNLPKDHSVTQKNGVKLESDVLVIDAKANPAFGTTNQEILITGTTNYTIQNISNNDQKIVVNSFLCESRSYCVKYTDQYVLYSNNIRNVSLNMKMTDYFTEKKDYEDEAIIDILPDGQPESYTHNVNVITIT